MSTSGIGFQPPLSNTGVPVNQSKPQIEVGLDCITGSFPLDKLTEVWELVEKVTHFKFSEEYTSSRFYHRHHRTPAGTFIEHHPRSSHQRNRGVVSVPGSVCSFLKPSDHRFLLIELGKLGFKATRLDVRIDDFTKTVTPQKVNQAIESRNYTGFTCNVYREYKDSGCLGSDYGQTFYLGRRGDSGSGKHFRCYTKWIQSRGLIDSNRFEAEFSQGYADRLFQVLTSLELSCWVDGMICFMTGAVDFIDRQSPNRIDKEISSCPRLDWWQFLVGDVPRIRLSKPRKEKTIKKAINWIEKQVLPTMAMVLSYFAKKHGSNMDEIFWEAWQRGDSRMSDVHRNILAISLGEMHFSR